MSETAAEHTEQQRTTSGEPAAEQGAGWRFLRNKRWFGYLAMLIVFAIACVWLSNWQWARRDEALEEIARIDAHYDAPPIPLTDALPTLDYYDDDQLKWQTVEMTGIYEGNPILARNRPGPEGVGSNLIQALRLEDGRVFFVDRGWVPLSGTDEVDTAEVPRAPSGEIQVQARLRASEPMIGGRTVSGHSVPSINASALADLIGDDNAYTAAYGQLVAESPASEHGTLAPRPERDEGPHLSYALQWVVFILIAGAGVVYAARQEFRALNAESESVRREDERRLRRQRKRGPSDAEEEDALIDGE